MYFKHGRYYHVVRGRWYPLSKDYAEALAQYGRRTAPRTGIAAMVDRCLAREDIKPNTRQQYEKCAERIKEAFVEFEPHEVTPPDVRRFLNLYKRIPVMANRMRSVLKMAFAEAVELGESPTNPVIGIKPFPEKARRRYLSDEEYLEIRQHANPRLQLIMDMAYLTGQRISDILALKRSDIKGNKIYVEQIKTGNRVEVESEALEDVVRAAAKLHRVEAITLFHNGQGRPYNYFAARDCFRRACEKAKVKDVQFRDIRAKSATDADGQGLNPTLLLGHSDARTTRIYLRSKKTIKAVGPKSIRQK